MLPPGGAKGIGTILTEKVEMADTWDYERALATFWIACVSHSSGLQGKAVSQPLLTLSCTKHAKSEFINSNQVNL